MYVCVYIYVCVYMCECIYDIYITISFVNYTLIMLGKKCTAIPWSPSHTLFIIHTACSSWSETLASLIKGWQVK